jgi:uncharacterized protein
VIIDCDTHNNPSPSALAPFLPARWADYLAAYGLRTPGELGMVRARWMSCRADSWGPNGEPPGTDLAVFQEQVFGDCGVDIAILNSIMMSAQMFTGGNQPQAFTNALMTAANEWVASTWLADEPRLYSAICSPHEDGEAAAEEIHRWGGDDRFVHVLLPFRMQKPMGNRKYWPLYEAAIAHDLPVSTHPATIGNNLVTGAGWVSFYYEDHTGLPQALFNQVASLIFEGVFDRYPTLKIIIQEGGWSWVAPFAWRLDRAFEEHRAEVPHLQRRPSEYIREHFWFTTQPIEEPERPEQFDQALAAFGMPDRLMFSTDYPHWDFDSPDGALPASIGPELRERIFSGNALALYPTIAAHPAVAA